VDDAIEHAVNYILSPSKWHSLSDVRREVLANMAFNLGSYKLA